MGPVAMLGKGSEPPDPLQIQAPPAAAPWPAIAAASQQEGRVTVGLLNIICSPYLFCSQQAINLTPCARFVLLPAPRFPFLKASVFVFVPEGDPLRLCVDVCAGRAPTTCPCTPTQGPVPPQPWQRVCKPRHRCRPFLGGRGQVPGSREGMLAAPAVCRRWPRAGVLSATLLEQCVCAGRTTAVFTLRGFLLLLLLLSRFLPALLAWDPGGQPAAQPC